MEHRNIQLLYRLHHCSAAWQSPPGKDEPSSVHAHCDAYVEYWNDLHASSDEVRCLILLRSRQLMIPSGAGFCVARFFVGLTEAPFFPGLTLSEFLCVSLELRFHG